MSSNNEIKNSMKLFELKLDQKNQNQNEIQT